MEPGPFGFEHYGLRLRLNGGEPTGGGYERRQEGAETVFSGVPAPGVAVEMRWSPLEHGAWRLRVVLRNETALPLEIRDLAFGQFGPKAAFHPHRGHVLGWALRYAHTGNLRTERYPFCAADYPYLRPLPLEPRLLGDTEDQPFPALFILNAETRQGLVIGAATQREATPVFALWRKALFRPDAFEQLEVRWDFPQAPARRIGPGEAWEPDELYFQLTTERGADLAFEDYLDYLSARHSFRGAHTVANDAALHCTWNYGVFADQRQEPLMKTARFIARELPGIRFFLVDDGYLQHTPRTSRVFLNRFYPDPEAELSRDTWPQGMRGFSDAIRALGLRPGLWWTPTVELPCALYDDHPDWFLRRRDGSLYLIGADRAYLDYSHPEALAFLDRTLAVILGQWGMDACKIDFWSQNFETRDAVLQNPAWTGLVARRHFLETVRRHLPPDGVVMSCIAMGMGNPFLGELVDTYRCSMDITDGLWHEQVDNARWTLATLGFGGRRSSLLNMDSVGINPELPESLNFFRLTWCFITMGLIETGGRLETLSPRYLQAMRKITDRCERGFPCRCADAKAYTGLPLPEALYVSFPPGSRTHALGIRQYVAFFNWGDAPALVSIHRPALGQPATVAAEDFWSGEEEVWSGPFHGVELPPRSARLFEVRW